MFLCVLQVLFSRSLSTWAKGKGRNSESHARAWRCCVLNAWGETLLFLGIDSTCLAIGDGNNDAPMIKLAGVGVAIRGACLHKYIAAMLCRGGRHGCSGCRRLRNLPSSTLCGAFLADCCFIAQFRFLPRLLLVHGHLNYRRIGLLIMYIFYKVAPLNLATLILPL